MDVAARTKISVATVESAEMIDDIRLSFAFVCHPAYHAAQWTRTPAFTLVSRGGNFWRVRLCCQIKELRERRLFGGSKKDRRTGGPSECRGAAPVMANASKLSGAIRVAPRRARCIPHNFTH